MLAKAFLITAFRPELQETFNLLKEICENSNISLTRGDTIYKDGLIINQVIDAIKQSDLIFGDITFNNPNVFYEIGVAHTFNKPTILLIKEEFKEVVPFNIRGFRYVIYSDKKELKKELAKYFLNLNNSNVINIPMDISNNNYIESIKRHVDKTYGTSPKFEMINYSKDNDYLLFQFDNKLQKLTIVTDANGIIRDSKITN